MEEEKYIGIQPDIRQEDEKLDDIKHIEIVATPAPVTWVQKDPSIWRKFLPRNQNGSSSCVFQTMAKITEICYWLKSQILLAFSASDGYEDRVNKPDQGGIAYDAFDLAGRGVATEASMPSQEMSEDQMNNAPRSAQAILDRELIKIGPRVDLPIKDIETVASTIQQTGKGIMLFFFATMDEWNRPSPTVLNPSLTIDKAAVVHSVTGVDITMWEGEKAVVIDDSWGKNFGINGQRVIKESFFQHRNFYAGYPMNFRLKGDLSYNFETNLAYGMMKNTDVKMLQEILQAEGFFPTNVDCTGNYLALTAKAVLAFQQKHAVAPDSELLPLKGRNVGPKTRAKLNEIYNK